MKNKLLFCLMFLSIALSVVSQSNFQWAAGVTSSSENLPQAMTKDDNGNTYVVYRAMGTYTVNGTSGTKTANTVNTLSKFVVAKYSPTGVCQNIVYAKSPSAGVDNTTWNFNLMYRQGYIYAIMMASGNIDIKFDNDDGTYNYTAPGNQKSLLVKFDTVGGDVSVRELTTGATQARVLSAVFAPDKSNIYLIGYARVNANTAGKSLNFNNGRGSITMPSTSTVRDSVFFLKTSYAGNDLTVTRLYGFSNTYNNGINQNDDYIPRIRTSGTNVFVVGNYNKAITIGSYSLPNPGTGTDIYVMCLNSEGVVQWLNTIKSSAADYAYAADVDADGNFYVAGKIEGNATLTSLPSGSKSLTNGGSSDYFIAKYTPSGKCVWAVNSANSNTDLINAIKISSDNNIYALGSFSSSLTVKKDILTSQGSSDVFVASYDTAGNALGAISYGGIGPDNFDRNNSKVHGALEINGSDFYTTTDHVSPVTIKNTTLAATNPVSNSLLVKHCPMVRIGGLSVDNTCTDASSITLTGYPSGGTFSGTGMTGNVFSPTVVEPGTYTITYTATVPAGCTNTYSRTINVIGPGTPSITNLSPSYCRDAASFTLAFSPTGGTVAIDGTPLGSYTFDPSTLSAGAHTVTYTVTNETGCSNSVSQSVTINAVPTVTISASSSSVCQGQTTTLTASGASSYSWSDGLGTANPVTPTISASTTYYVTGTAANGCTATASSAITSLANPTVTLTVTSATICSGSSTTVTASGASSYAWNPDLGSGASHSVSPVSTTTYNVTGTAANGCTDSKSVLVTVNTSPTVSLSASSATICAGSSTTLTASGATSYAWNPDLGSGASHSVSPTSTTTYSVTGTAANGCTGSQSVEVTVNPNPTVTVEASPTMVCNGSSSTLTASGAASYTWSNGLGTGDTKTVSPSSNTTYTVTGTTNGCSNTASVLLTVNPNANITPSCSGTTVTLTANAGTGFTYQWNDVSNSTTQAITPAAGTYTVTVTNGPCQNTATYTLTNYPGVSITKTYTTTATGPGAATLAATLTASGSNYTYLWSTTQTVNPITPPSTDTYSVTATDTNTCTSNSSASVNLNPDYYITNMTQSPVSYYTPGGATDYEWTFYDGTNTIVKTRGNSTTSLTLTSVGPSTTTPPGTKLQYNTTYTVTIRAWVSGAWQPAGSSRTMIINSIPSTSMATNVNTAYTSTASISCTQVGNATDYEWTFVEGVNTITKLRGASSTNLILSTVSGLKYNTTYTVGVKAIVGSTYGPAGATKTLYLTVPTTTPSGKACDGNDATMLVTDELTPTTVYNASTYNWHVTTTEGADLGTLNGSSTFMFSQLGFIDWGSDYNYLVYVAAVCGTTTGSYAQTGCLLSVTGEKSSIETEETDISLSSDIVSDEAFSVFPVPATGTLTLTTPVSSEMYDVVMNTADGFRVLATRVAAGQATDISLRGIMPGVYIMKVSNNEHSITKQVIVQ